MIYLYLIIHSTLAWAMNCGLEYQQTYMRENMRFVENTAEEIQAPKLPKYKEHEIIMERMTEANFTHKKILSSSASLEEKMQSLDKMYFNLGTVYHFRKSIIHPRFVNQLKALRQEFAGYSNEMIVEAAKILDAKSINYSIEASQEGGIPFNFIVIKTKQQTQNEIVSKLNAFKREFEVKNLTIDFYSTKVIDNPGGFYNSNQSRLELGFEGLQSILFEDMVKVVARHEFAHAAFQKARGKMRASIYNVKYLAKGEKMLTQNSAYQNYMSGEEIYNYANNPFWASGRLANPKLYSSDFIKADLQSITNYINRSEKVFEQGKNLTKNFEEKMKSIETQILNGEYSFDFVTANLTGARSLEEAYQVTLHDGTNNFMLYSFIDASEFETVKAIYKNRADLESKFADRIAQIKTEEENIKLIQEFRKNDAIINKDLYLKLLESVNAKQATLGKVASTMLEETQLLKIEQARVQKLLETAPDEMTDELALELMTLRQKYRDFGNLVKENFKGFVGK